MALMPEIKLEPTYSGPSDEDRVKDMFEKMFLLEYTHSRNVTGLDYDEALSYADEAAKGSADYYRAWLKEQEPKPESWQTSQDLINRVQDEVEAK